MKKSKELLENIAKAIVDNPEAIVVTETNDDMGVLLTLDAHKDDMGKIIGRSGNTAKAIRAILHVAGMTENARVSLKINEPEGGTRQPTDFKSDVEDLKI